MTSDEGAMFTELVDPKKDFNFDYWMKLAKDNPAELERQRQLANQHFIDNASDRLKRKGSGLLFQINATIDSSPNPMSSCIKLSKMMHESFNELRDVLNNGVHTSNHKNEQPAQVLQFIQKQPT